MTRLVGEINGWDLNIVEINGAIPFFSRARARCWDSSYMLELGLIPEELCLRLESKCTTTVFFAHGCGCDGCTEDGKDQCPGIADAWQQGIIERVTPDPPPPGPGELSTGFRVFAGVEVLDEEYRQMAFAYDGAAWGGPAVSQEYNILPMERPNSPASDPVNDYSYTLTVECAPQGKYVAYWNSFGRFTDPPANTTYVTTEKVYVVDADTGLEAFNIDADTWSRVAFNTDGSQLAVINLKPGGMTVRNVPDGTVVAGAPGTAEHPSESFVDWGSKVVFNDKFLAFVYTSTLYVYDATDWTLLTTKTAADFGGAAIFDLAAPSDGRWLAMHVTDTVGSTDEIVVIETDTFTETDRAGAGVAGFAFMQTNAAGTLLAYTEDSDILKILDTSDWTLSQTLLYADIEPNLPNSGDFSMFIQYLSFDPTGQKLLISCRYNESGTLEDAYGGVIYDTVNQTFDANPIQYLVGGAGNVRGGCLQPYEP